MFIFPVNFTGSIKYLSPANVTKQEINTEFKRSHIAMQKGIEVPEYKGCMTREGMVLECRLDGDPADVNTNPVTQAHLKNLFSNFCKLEEIGLHYKTLSPDNVFYGKNGKVEIDSLRSAHAFSISNDSDFILPSNADSYEADSLCSYIDSIKDKYKQHGFLMCYLKQKSKYHFRRMEMLLEQGVKPDSKAVSSENDRYVALRDPSNKIINYVNDKFEIYILKNEAAKEWHDGNIFADGKAKPKKRFVSSILSLEALKRTVMLEENMNIIAKESENKAERDYFAFEAKQTGKLKQEIFDTIEKNGSINFADKNYGKFGLYLGTKADKEFYDKTFKIIKDDMKTGKSAETICKSIDILEDFYRTRTIEWKFEKNKAYKLTHDNPNEHKADIIPIEERLAGKPSATGTAADIYSRQAQTGSIR